MSMLESTPVEPIKVIRYALASGPLPPVTRTLGVGELARRAALARYGGEQKRPTPPVLSGHADAGPTCRQMRTRTG